MIDIFVIFDIYKEQGSIAVLFSKRRKNHGNVIARAGSSSFT